MPFTDPVSSISGRNSRASNVSAATGASRSVRSPPPMGAGVDMLANAGVLSMLKTSTDTGDIGALSFNSTRLPSMPYRSGQRRQQPTRTSGSSHPYHNGSNSQNYAASVNSRISSATRDWETGSNGRRGSMTSMQTMPTFVSDTQPSIMSHPGRPMGLGPIPSSGGHRDSRSYSLTNAVPPSQLPRHKSATSLKSQGHEPRRYNGNPPPMPEIRQPYVYPTRLKRPGYRSPSPALSDTYVQGPPPPMPQQHMHRRQNAPPPVPPMPRPPMPTYHSDYGQDNPTNPAHLNVPPPSRAMSVSPVTDYEQMPPPQPHFNYRPGPLKPARSMPMQHSGQHPPQPPMPHLHPQQTYGPPRPAYPPTSYPMQPQHRRGPPPNPNVGPVAHHIFHNAVRLARQLPQRTDTPVTDIGVPSSDPPSSGTAPTTSSPPTPKDQTTIHVAVDPAFIDPTLTDLPESTSDPVIPAKYFDYTDGLEKAAEDSEIEIHHASVPPSGFVQRVKAMLESRAAADAAAKIEAEREHGRGQAERPIEVYELSAVESPRVTIIEEFNAPVELPASPVLIAEMPASPVKSMRRLTRDMVKAEMALSTTEVEPSSKVVIIETPSPLKPEETLAHDEQEQDTFEPSSLNEEHMEDDPSMPSSPPDIQHKGSVTESVASTGGQSKVSGMDFAVHFSPPSESETTATDLGATETESRDPFALDADTITARNKESKEHLADPESDDPPQDPVSPLLLGETVDRFSAVSPIQEETAGIDETIMAIGSHSSPSDDRSKRLHRNAYQDENQPPPTPRTPRGYSKSVHLPQPSNTPTESNASNRLSLPADLSQIGDTTVNTTMDAMTDVAVRFSLPQNTVTLGKPQIVQIPSSTPPKDEPVPLKSAIHVPERQRRHGSVTFEDEVAPLKVNKKTEQHRQSQSLSAIALRNRSQQPTRGPSPFEEQSGSDRGSRESTTDLRFSGINFIRNKYPSTHLPGLKEESSEDMSMSTHRQSTDIANGLHFQLPARIAAVKAMQERRQQELQDKAKIREGRHHPHPDAGRPLAETRDLPSLNFSRMDLIDKLNEALQVRTSKSMEVVRRRDFSEIYHPSPQRPQSTDPLLWDRYTSFFNKPEDFPAEVEEEDPSSEEDEVEEVAEESRPSSRRHSKATSEADSAQRPLSPEERQLNLATQVNRLSIPSVNGLSERLSELLPCLRDLNLDSVLVNDRIAHTLEDIHQLGHIPAARPGTVLSTRTSAGFQTLAERAEEIVKNGTHDSVVPYRALGLNKELPPLPGSLSLDKVSALNSGDGKASYLSGSISAPSDITNLLERPASALLRGKSPLTEDEVRNLLPPEMNPIARGSKRSLIVSSLSSRPWNLDENYPWARSNLHIDLTAPDQVYHRDNLAAEVARHRGTKSLDCTITGDLLGNTTSGIDIGSINTDMDPTASLTTLQLTGISTQHTRKHSKRSMLGSIKHKMGLSRSHHDDTTRSLPTSPGLRTADEATHKPGDRYPSTALTPPVGFNLDEVRSYFSDDSSESNKERKTPKGRRWTGLKSKSKNTNPDPNRTQSLDGGIAGAHPYDAGSMNERTGIDSSAAYTLDGISMGKAEFRIKRIGEKLRVLFAKGGELIRSLSTRSRNKKSARERDEWLSDSLYSGV